MTFKEVTACGENILQVELYFQLLNPLVFAGFAIGFLCVYQARPGKAALVIACSYIFGALAFVLDLAFPHIEFVPARVVIAGAYAVTAVLLSGGLWLYYRERAPWRLLIMMTVVHLLIYGWLYAQGFAWWRSFAANIGCGLIFFVGLLAFPKRGLTPLDKALMIVHASSCIQCLLRPIIVALLIPGPVTSESHSEAMLLMTLHLFVGVAAVLTGMLLLGILIRDLLQDLKSNSLTDELTGVYNRRGFEARFDSWTSMRDRSEVGIILADLDRFKRINDTYGHKAGDDVLIAVGEALQTYAGPGRIAARLGGEEFVLAIRNVPMSEVKGIAETLRVVIAAKTFQFDDSEIKVTASFGVAQVHAGENIRNALARADDALYLAKRDGRDCVRCQADLAVDRLTRTRDQLKPEREKTGPAKQKVS